MNPFSFIVSFIKIQRHQCQIMFYFKLQMLTLIALGSWTMLFNPIRVEGGCFSPHFFQMAISPWKGVWRSKILCLFLIHYELSENPKTFLFLFWGDLEGAGWFSTPPPLSSNIQEPISNRVNGCGEWAVLETTAFLTHSSFCFLLIYWNWFVLPNKLA